MILIEREESKRAAEFLAQRLVDGSLKKDYLPNPSTNFTGGPEQLARMAFNRYLGSCGYALMEMRLKRSGYHG